MPAKVYNNVEGHRLIDNGYTVEDITQIAVPTISFPTTPISASGMAMDVDMPNMTHLEAMEFGISHNNGTNGKRLSDPGRHFIETRVVRQRYNVAGGQIEHESVKFRVTGVLKNIEKGNIETGNPYGSTNKYSVLRYEEEINGEIVTLIDAMAGTIKFNGKNYTDAVENLLK